MLVKKYIGVGTTHISKKGRDYVLDTLKKNRLTYGEYSRRFENLFARLHQRKFALICNSGTSALHVSLDALKKYYRWHDNDEVIVPAVTFVTSVNVVLQNHLKPKFVDVDPIYYDIDVKKIEKAITDKTRAIMATHLFGQPANMKEIVPIAKKYSLKIIEDSCETMFAKHDGKPVSSWGDVACFSTYSAHLVTTGVGGMVTTDNADLVKLIKSLFNHGRDNVYLSLEDDNNTNSENFSFVMKNRFHFIHLGYNCRITEMESALGLAQLEEYEKIIRPRQKNAAYLTKKLTPLSSIFQLPQIRKNGEHVFMMYPIVIVDDRVKRDDFLLFLERKGIETRYLLPLINQPIYKFLKINQKDFPVADFLNRRGFYIGCHQDLKKDDLDYIVENFYQYVQKHTHLS